MAVGALFLMGSLGLGLGSLGEPGPGFFPFVMAVFLVLFSLKHFVSSLVKRGPSGSAPAERVWPESDGIKRILLTIMFLLGFIFALNYLGFVLNTLLFMFASLRFIEPQKWPRVFLIGSLTTVVSYSIFQFWLRSNLPVGFLGF
jgi:hypothetical protein